MSSRLIRRLMLVGRADKRRLVALVREDGTVVCPRCTVAATPLRRMKGLLGRKDLPPGEGVLLRPASSIHMLFMRFPIDAVFLDRELRRAQGRAGPQAVALRLGPRLEVGRRARRRRGRPARHRSGPAADAGRNAALKGGGGGSKEPPPGRRAASAAASDAAISISPVDGVSSEEPILRSEPRKSRPPGG